jgi:hypothetical protein
MSVYFASAGGYVKIGYSADPIGRMTTVTRNGTRPADIPRGADARLLGWVPGNHADEAAWHRRFAADHVAGEWFYLDPDLVRGLIWDDPCGIDMERMSTLAVFAAHANPGVSREQIAAAGIAVDAVPFDQLDVFGGAAS